MPSVPRAYYKILQVDPAAEPEVIKAAYQRLANKYHPDKNKSPDANRRMQEINDAYDVLGDPAKRAEYDRRRSAGPDQNQGEDARERYEAEAARRHDKEAAGAAQRRAEEERRRREGAEAAQRRAEEERRRREGAEAAQRRAQEEQEQHADQRRTRTSAVIAVMVVAVVVAFGMLVRTNDDNKPGSNSAEPTALPQVQPPYQIEKEISPESEVCTISADTKDGITHGTVYFAGDGDKNGDKIRVNRETSLNNIKKPDHILINSKIAYFWSKNKGIKFHHKGLPPKSFFAVFPGLTRLQYGPVKDNWSWRSTSRTTKWSISPLTKYECQKWTPDDSVFVPPININFLDASGEDATGESNIISYVDNVWGR